MLSLSTFMTPYYLGSSHHGSSVRSCRGEQYAKAFPGIKINAVDPGYTATDLNGRTGTQAVEQGAEVIVRMAQIGRDGPTGGYFDVGGPLAW